MILGFMLFGLVLFPTLGHASDCVQPRTTAKAPDEFYQKKSPLHPTKKNLEKGRFLYLDNPEILQCKHCHGEKGDGTGELGAGSNPPVRDFTCSATMNSIPDGQLFWIIKNGSKGTGMPAYDNLSNEEIWQLILYIRHFAK